MILLRLTPRPRGRISAGAIAVIAIRCAVAGGRPSTSRWRALAAGGVRKCPEKPHGPAMRYPGEKIVLDRQLTDLGVKLLDLTRRRRLGVQPDLRIKHALRMVQHRLLPDEDRVRELGGAAPSRSLSPVRATPQARSSPSAQRSVFRRVFVMLRPVQSHSEQTSSNQASGPKIRGHFMLSSIGAKVRWGLFFVGSSNDRRTSDFPILRGIAKPCCGVPLLVGQLGPSF